MAQDGVTFAGDVTINSIELIAGSTKLDILSTLSVLLKCFAKTCST